MKSTNRAMKILLELTCLKGYAVEDEIEEEEQSVEDTDVSDDTSDEDALNSWLDDVFEPTEKKSEKPVGEVQKEASDQPEVEKEDEVETEEEVEEEEVQTKPEVKKPASEQPKVEEEVEEQEPRQTDEQVQAQIAAYKGELEKQYAISDDDADLILSDPKTVLPRLMANMHLSMLKQVGQLMQEAMPNLVQSQVKTVSTTEKRLAAFQERYPDLVTKEAQKATQTAIQTVKALHPNISFEELLDKVGPVAYSLLGKTAPAKKSEAKAPAVAKPRPHIQAAKTSTAANKAPLPSDPTDAFFATLQKY